MLKGAANMEPCVLEFALNGVDFTDGVRAGLTAIPNVASGSAGALLIAGSGTAALNVSSGNVAGSVASVAGAVASVTGNVGGNVTGSVGSVVGGVGGAVASVTGACGSVAGAVGSVTGSVGSVAANGINNASFASDVGSTAVGTNVIAIAAKKGVVDALNVDTYAEPGQGSPASTTTMVTKLAYLYKLAINKITQTATTESVFNAAGSVVDQKSTTSDDGTTMTRGAIVTGP